MKKWIMLAGIAFMIAVIQAEAKDDSSGDAGAKKGGIAAMDTDKDGQVSKDEFVSYNEKKAEKAGKEFDSKKCESKFEKMDKDSDGALTAEELAAAKKARQEKQKKESEEGDEE